MIEGKEKRQQRTSLSGTVEGDVRSGKSASGKSYLKFYLRTGDTVYECVAFDGTAESGAGKLDPGLRVVVRGYFKDEIAKTEKQLTVSLISMPEAGEYKTAIEREYGSIENFRKEMRKVEEEKAAKGLYKAFEIDGEDRIFHRWVAPEDSVIDSKGVRWTKIQYLINELGGELVTAELRRFSKAIFGRDKTWVPEYRKKLDELVSLAKQGVSFEYEYDS